MSEHPTQRRRSAEAARRRSGLSLLELAGALAIIGLLVAAGVTTFGTTTIANIAAEGFARRLALDLVQARRRTIATGDNHYLQMTIVASKVTSYTMYRRAAGGDVVVEATRLAPAGATATASHATFEFDFDGAALAAYAATVAGPSRSWTVSTTAVTGSVRIQ